LTVFHGSRAGAQPAPRQLPVVRDLTISGTANDLSPISSIAVSPRGWIAVGQRDDNRVLVFRADGQQLFSFGRGGEGPGEFRRLTAYSGWLGDTLWVTDIGTQRATFIDGAGKLLRVMPFPLANSARRTVPPLAPNQSDPTPFTFATDGTVGLASGVAGTSQPPAWREALRGVTGVVWSQRIDGSTTTMVGIMPNPIAACERGTPPRQQLECFGTSYALSPVAGRLLTVSPPEGSREGDGLRIRVMAGPGAPLVDRIVPLKRAPMTEAVRDSVRERCASQAPTPARQAECRSRPVASFLRPVFRSMLGLDHTIWIELRPDAAGRHWMVLSPTGETIGRVTLPPTFLFRVGTRTALWGTEEDADGIQSAVRYRIGA
jgi:hypothetical protein